MPSSVHPNNEFLRPTREMVISSERKKNSKQEKNCKIVKQRVPSPQASRSPKCQDKLEVRVKSSGTGQRSFVKVNTSKEDELVKYMSNLPGYLQRAERGENNQDKALNFGVLDWAQLEKWNYKQNRIPARGGDNALCRSCDLSLKAADGSSTFPSKVHSKMSSERHPLPHPSLDSSHKDGHPQDAKLSDLNTIQFHDFETASKSNMDGQQKVPWTYKSFSRSCSDIMLDKGKRKDLNHMITSEMGNSATSSGTNGISLSRKYDASAWDGEAKKSIKELQDSDIKRKDGDKKIPSEIRSSHSDWRSHGFSLHSKEKLGAGRGENRKRIEELEQSDINLFNLCSPGEHTNIVLLPKELSQNQISEVFQLSQPRESKKKSSEALRSSFSGNFSGKDVHSEVICSDVPHSCPLPSGETDPTSDMIPDSLINAQHNKLSSVASLISKFPNKTSKILPKGIYAEGKDLDIKLNNSDVHTAKAADEETTVLDTKKDRNPSPNHRFRFITLGRLGRSFSFKEGSSVPKLSSSNASVKSGPVRSESSACLDTSIREKPNVPNRAKSSPLRRLFDPILRYKVANSLHSAETPQPVKASLDFISSSPSRVCHSLQKEKREASNIQALLQLRVKNGLPLFKFGVENDRNILAATMKNLISSGKDDSGGNYTFYSVNEITKKSGGWISQGSKRDSCGYVYNVVGQMKASGTCFSDLSGPNSHNDYMVRKSVLLGVEPMQEDQEPLKFTPKRELAAVVVKIPFKNLSPGGMKSDKELMEKLCMTCLPEGRCSCNFKEKKNLDGITVILPGAVHGPPNIGEPSPLIDRWDGSCDCGGWDIGCKLHVLSNQNRSSRIHVTSKACPILDNVELFVQEEPRRARPSSD
ncbi:uncharacterized protein LOC121265228 [Juglans microcarpa x Juglans regia]|uniref:uncharacterized protein LOC121265228 n=1 Tax=Juglans microcarpa x Juglans regia TaxID=2249226 RepID=UPI001B7E0C15|nr:uncharacterized protein LOC121265228 [Juglans microcarpa x Juglans regia]XP_041024707.1 uncharacterized protein LOC121265228 [Juglans microcarpa x Juglans regia]XP_041024708.1 uncharacterized protein LOC121265228 [Juglans microcarpa x Juglans regia]XP_041024709.1 uncharacterized protein LOC121265228 [Juglans microcarpa x Juglans regia]XP_041024710.1 uncharacterized protein LOC121265228 [Juglans microcarpa x Juglans regia]